MPKVYRSRNDRGSAGEKKGFSLGGCYLVAGQIHSRVSPSTSDASHMESFQGVHALQTFLAAAKNRGQSIGFVPTMGALHQGHLALVAQSNALADLTVVSIFVNPTQFNDPGDLAKYPRMPEQDLALLAPLGTAAVFLPSVTEIYPPGLDTVLQLDLGHLTTVMEGQFRPGHFAGMAQVVKRLLDIVAPDFLIMGQKDYQQFAIVKAMINQLGRPTQLIMGPTVREADGLAMSSRNLRLIPELRREVPAIYATLRWAREALADRPSAEVQAIGLQRLQQHQLRPEYFEVVDANSLEPVALASAHRAGVVACVAAWAGEVRLIDNIVVK